MNRCYVGDTRKGMRAFIAEGLRVQTVVTSPPYYGLRDYGVKGQLGLEPTLPHYLRAMVRVFRVLRELLADDGTVWLNMGDSWAGSPGGWQGLNGQRATRTFTARIGMHKGGGAFKHKDLMMVPARLAIALQEDGWYLRQQIIWHKPNCMPESHRDRFTNAHEYVYLLAKQRTYYFDQAVLMEPASEDTHARYARGRSNDHKYADGGPGGQTIARTFAHMAKPVAGWANDGAPHSAVAHARTDDTRTRKLLTREGGSLGRAKNNPSFDAAMRDMPVMRKKRSVWTIPSEPFADAHFATFPRALVEPCILAGSRQGDVVFDPFMGSGRTAQVAVRLGRQWAGCELNPEYVAMQAGLTAQPALLLEAAD